MDDRRTVPHHVSRRHILQILTALGITGAAADQLAASAVPAVSPAAFRARPICSRADSTSRDCASRGPPCSATSISCKRFAIWSCGIASSPPPFSR